MQMLCQKYLVHAVQSSPMQIVSLYVGAYSYLELCGIHLNVFVRKNVPKVKDASTFNASAAHSAAVLHVTDALIFGLE